MKLTAVQVHNFRNILDSTSVPIQPDVTCLVGKNESGKTAFLHALWRLNPANGGETFQKMEYPAWLAKRDRLAGADLNAAIPIKATFLLEAEDLRVLEERFGKGVLKSTHIPVTRDYGGKSVWHFSTDESAVVQHVLRTVGTLPVGVKKDSRKLDSIGALNEPRECQRSF